MELLFEIVQKDLAESIDHFISAKKTGRGSCPSSADHAGCAQGHLPVGRVLTSCLASSKSLLKTTDVIVHVCKVDVAKVQILQVLELRQWGVGREGWGAL